MGVRKGYQHPFRSLEITHDDGTVDERATREATGRLKQGVYEAFEASGINSPRELAEEIGRSERTARKYFNNPATITKDAYQKMLKSKRLGAFILAARYGSSMEYAKLVATAEPVCDPEMVEMTQRIIRSFLRLSKEDMGHVLAAADAFAKRNQQNQAERITCNYIRGKISKPGFFNLASELDRTVLDKIPTITQSSTDL
ncbi:hypothetical protein HMPREF1248_1569 [Coriobacteriaceae bacterium BV3Ac1]|nr:hypothetical protein [Olegusella massiliensis]ERL12814.1 hypothetical protein HMPREF1248_1569 [Coriobacteriaceae bacterium BV3Ac1]